MRAKIVSLILITMYACAPSISVINNTPIQNTGTNKIAILQTQNVTKGSVGKHHDGLLAIPQYSWDVGSNISASFPVLVTDVIWEEMKQAGYDITNVSKTPVKNYKEEGLTISLSVSIESLEVQTYSPRCGNRSDVIMLMRFDINDLTSGEKVYTESYRGNASKKGVDPIAVILLAARNATQAFLGDKLAASILSGNDVDDKM